MSFHFTQKVKDKGFTRVVERKMSEVDWELLLLVTQTDGFDD